MLLPNEILIPQVAELVRMGKTVTLPLRGFSMRPYLENDRDKALLSAVPEELHIGDVILAETAPQRWALHRIVDIQGDSITMCGDGNYTPEYIERKDVIAIALGFYRKGAKHPSSVNTWHYRLYWRTWIRMKPYRHYLLLLWRLHHEPKQAIKKISNLGIKKSFSKIIRLCK